MAAESFNFIGKHEGKPNKNRDFLKFRFSDSLKAQNRPQRGPLPFHLIGPFLSSGFTSGLRPLPTCFQFVFPLGAPRALFPTAPRHPLWYVVCRRPLGCSAVQCSAGTHCGLRAPAFVAVLWAANRKKCIAAESTCEKYFF